MCGNPRALPLLNVVGVEREMSAQLGKVWDTWKVVTRELLAKTRSKRRFGKVSRADRAVYAWRRTHALIHGVWERVSRLPDKLFSPHVRTQGG